MTRIIVHVRTNVNRQSTSISGKTLREVISPTPYSPCSGALGLRKNILASFKSSGLRFTSMSQIYTAGSSIPLLAYGESYAQDGRKMLPRNVHVNHAFVDGSHMQRYFQRVQNYLDSPR